MPGNGEGLKTHRWILGLVALVALAALVVWGRGRIHFDFGVFRAQLAMADWRKIAIGFACIYLAYVFRAARWAQLLKHNKKVPPLSLLGTQVIGFTAVALLGRVADPVRPYLVSKKTGLKLSSQIAVYIVERLFDAGSMALIFSSSILLAAWFGGPGALPHAEIVKKSGYWGMAITLSGRAVSGCRAAGGRRDGIVLRKRPGPGLKAAGPCRGEKECAASTTGLDTMRTFFGFCAVGRALSLGHVADHRAGLSGDRAGFSSSPPLATMTLAKCMLLLAFSGGASVFQLPVLGWFTQIGLVAAAISSFFGAAPEASTACAAMLLVVTFLGIVPVGLVWAQREHVNLRKITVESEHAEEELTQEEPAG